jgi:ferric-dicitrate binding protein FerR (iron transport regulator)
MKAFAGRLAASLCFLILAAPHGNAAGEGERIGKVDALIGLATRTLPDGGGMLALALADPVHEGDTVRTGPGSKLRIALVDGSIVALGEKTELVLEHLGRRTDAPGAPTTVSLLGGFLRTVVAPLHASGEFQVHTPSMVAAVRGTDWIEHYDGGKTEIFVEGGHVAVSGTGTGAASTAVIDPGMGTFYTVSLPLTRGVHSGSAGSAGSGGHGRPIDSGPHGPIIHWGAEKVARFVDATSLP